jgi:hypothetical protein
LRSEKPAAPVVVGDGFTDDTEFAPSVGWTGGGVDTTVMMTTDGVTISPGAVGVGVTMLVMISVEGACGDAVMTEVGTLVDDAGAGAGVDDGGGAAEEADEGATTGVELGWSDEGGGDGGAEEDGANEGVGVADGSGDELGAAEGSIEETNVGEALDNGADEAADKGADEAADAAADGVADDTKREDVPAEVLFSDAIVMAETKR